MYFKKAYQTPINQEQLTDRVPLQDHELERMCDSAAGLALIQIEDHVSRIGPSKDGTNDLDKFARLENRYHAVLDRLRKIEREEDLPSPLEIEDRRDTLTLWFFDVVNGRPRTLDEILLRRHQRIRKCTHPTQRTALLIDEYDRLHEGALVCCLTNPRRTKSQKTELYKEHRKNIRLQGDYRRNSAAAIRKIVSR